MSVLKVFSSKSDIFCWRSDIISQKPILIHKITFFCFSKNVPQDAKVWQPWPEHFAQTLKIFRSRSKLFSLKDQKKLRKNFYSYLKMFLRISCLQFFAQCPIVFCSKSAKIKIDKLFQKKSMKWSFGHVGSRFQNPVILFALKGRKKMPQVSKKNHKVRGYCRLLLWKLRRKLIAYRPKNFLKFWIFSGDQPLRILLRTPRIDLWEHQFSYEIVLTVLRLGLCTL